MNLTDNIFMGFASPLDEQQIGHITIDEWLITDKNATYLVRMQGDAMESSHIMDGDLLLVLRTDKVVAGDLVYALQGDETVVRHLRNDTSNTPYLENAPKQSFAIEGKVIGVVRKF